MLRTFQFRLLPNAGQVALLDRTLADNAETYNAALSDLIASFICNVEQVS